MNRQHLSMRKLSFSPLRESMIGLLRRHSLICATATCLVVGIQPAIAKEYYIAPNGDDEAGGTLAAPWVSAARFAQIAEPGDTLYIRGGIYRAQETILTRSGTAEKPITFRNYADEVPIFDGTDTHWNAKVRYPNAFYSEYPNYIRYITFEGLVIRNYFRGGIHLGSNYIPNSPEQSNDHITIRHCLVDKCGQNGINVSNGDWLVVENNVVGRTGWRQEAGSWSSNINVLNMLGTNNRVIGNVSFHAVDVSNYHTDGNGMILDWADGPPHVGGATVENNLFFENGGVGIAWTKNQNANINNNTLWDNGKEPTYVHPDCGIYFWDATTNINLRNTIVWQPKGGDAMQMNGPFVSGTRTNNLITKQPGAADPKLADPAKLDFTLAADSPARAAATATDAPANSLLFDRSILKAQTTDQPIPWYRWAPDYDQLIAKGGLAHCLALAKRPAGKTDIGAFSVSSAPPLAAMAKSPNPIVATNLVVNGTFEVPAKQWELAKNAATNGAQPHGGTLSLQMNGSGSWSSSSQIILVKPNTKYVYSAWIKGTCNVNMKVVTPAWGTIAEGVQQPTGTWTHYEVRFNSGTNSVLLVALMDGSTGTSYVDGVSLVAE